MVRGRAKAFLAGPPLLKAATGEIATDEELGGAVMHTHLSGLGEYLAENDVDGIRYAREVMARLVDYSDFLDFKADYVMATLCGHAAVQGHRVGIVTNNGPLDPAGAN